MVWDHASSRPVCAYVWSSEGARGVDGWEGEVERLLNCGLWGQMSWRYVMRVADGL